MYYVVTIVTTNHAHGFYFVIVKLQSGVSWEKGRIFQIASIMFRETFNVYMIGILLVFAGTSNAQINKNCHDESIGLHFCASEDYFKGVDHDKTLDLKEKLLIIDIPEFRPDDKTITIFMRLETNWNDPRIKTKSSDPNL